MASSISYSKQTNIGTVLIEDTSCLGTSISTIQQNFNILSQIINQLTTRIEGYQNKIEAFNNNNIPLTYINTFLPATSASYADAQDFVLKNYTSWSSTPFSVFYTKIMNLTEWYSTSSYRYQDIPQWLQVNFPAGNFPSSQTVDVFVFLKEESFSNFTYSNSYLENCSTQTILQPITCSNCASIPTESLVSGSSNCGSRLKVLGNVQPCEGSGGRLLSLGVTRQNIKDTGIRRVEKLVYRKTTPRDGLELNRWYPL